MPFRNSQSGQEGREVNIDSPSGSLTRTPRTRVVQNTEASKLFLVVGAVWLGFLQEQILDTSNSRRNSVQGIGGRVEGVRSG